MQLLPKEVVNVTNGRTLSIQDVSWSMLLLLRLSQRSTCAYTASFNVWRVERVCDQARQTVFEPCEEVEQP